MFKTLLFLPLGRQKYYTSNKPLAIQQAVFICIVPFTNIFVKNFSKTISKIKQRDYVAEEKLL
jgi:hypothetical protein